jgi:hypothetical protein
MEHPNEKLIAFLKEAPNSNKQAITAVTGISGLHLFNLLKKLQNEGAIISHDEGDEIVYSINEEMNVEKQVESEQTKEEKIAAPETQPAIQQKVIKIGRNNTQYMFNEKEYGKGPLVHAVVAQYINDKPDTTFEQLKEIFPDTLMKRFGVFALETEARSMSGKVNRYFLKEEQLIKLKASKEPIAVCNQWTSALLEPFLGIVKNLRYEIKTVE